MELEYPLSYNWEEPDVDETYDPDFADPFVHAESHNLARLRMWVHSPFNSASIDT